MKDGAQRSIANIERKKRAEHSAAWKIFVAETPNLPFAGIPSGRARVGIAEIGWWRIGLGLAIHAVALFFRGQPFGVAPLPAFSF